MKKYAFYGKGGIGKSTTVSNLSAALADMGYRVLQIGCDPKADSTLLLHGDENKPSVLELIRKKNRNLALEEMITTGYGGVMCVEAGGPIPGLGCAGRGITIALEALADRRADEILHPDFVFYDVLGDVVCGGFSMPIRRGYADSIYIITSGEPMALHAARVINEAVGVFKKRGYATLGGIIANRRNCLHEQENLNNLCREFGTDLTGSLAFSPTVQKAEELGRTVIEAFPDSDAADMYRALARTLSGGAA